MKEGVEYSTPSLLQERQKCKKDPKDPKDPKDSKDPKIESNTGKKLPKTGSMANPWLLVNLMGIALIGLGWRIRKEIGYQL